MNVTFQQIKKIEGLAHSLKQTRDRKRKGFTIHADELPGLIDCLQPAIDLMNKEFIANVEV